MTREEFVKKHADEFLGRLMRAASLDKTSPLAARWIGLQVAEIDGWLGSLHDTLTEALNAQQQRTTTPSKPGEARGSGATAKPPPAR